jgi:hypothetical protein
MPLSGRGDHQFTSCLERNCGDNFIVSAAEVIEQIKELSAGEQAQVAKFIAENGTPKACRQFLISTAVDGLPVIRANGGTITSQLVHEIESLMP